MKNPLSPARRVATASVPSPRALGAPAPAPTVSAAAGVRSQARTVIDAPLDRVWRLLTEVAKWPRWNPAVQSAALRGPWVLGAEFVWKSQGFTVRSTVQELQPMHRLSWTGRAFGTRAVHGWTLELASAGVVVRTHETMDGWLPQLLRGGMQRKLDDTLPQWLAALKRAAESAER